MRYRTMVIAGIVLAMAPAVEVDLSCHWRFARNHLSSFKQALWGM